MPFASPPVAAEVQRALAIEPVREPTAFEVGVTAPTHALDDDLIETVAYDPPADRRSSEPPRQPGTELMPAYTVPIPNQATGLDALAQTKAMTESVQAVHIGSMPTPGLDTTLSDSAPPSDPLMVTIKEEPSFAGPSSRRPKPQSVLVYVAVGLFATALFVLVGIAIWYFVLRDDGAAAGASPRWPSERTIAAIDDEGAVVRLARVGGRRNGGGHDGRAR